MGRFGLVSAQTGAQKIGWMRRNVMQLKSEATSESSEADKIDLQELYPDFENFEKPRQDELKSRLVELRQKIYWWNAMAPWRKKQLLEGAPLDASERLTEQEAKEWADQMKRGPLVYDGHVFFPGVSPVGVPLRDIEDNIRFAKLLHPKNRQSAGKQSNRYRRLLTALSRSPALARQITETKGREGAELCRKVLKEAKIRVHGDQRDKLNIAICRRAAHSVMKSRI
jgi:hypothetical protein